MKQIQMANKEANNLQVAWNFQATIFFSLLSYMVKNSASLLKGESIK